MLHVRPIQREARALPSAHPQYRPDIDGLRAIAVLSVVLYHAFPRLLRSGFVGVDIFFVISGFLISTIIFSSVERGGFSFLDFYGRRIRRIFPALIVVMAAGFVFAWFFLFADEFKQLGEEMAAGSGFVANLLFMNERGYFDPNVMLKPLVHLWSLGVEEQYYILWPLLVWGASKLRFNLLALTLAIAGVSFLLSASAADQDPVTAFYAPQSRFWELLAGSALAFITLRRERTASAAQADLSPYPGMEVLQLQAQPASILVREWQSVIGAWLIVSAILFTDEAHFLGWAALPVIAGATLAISAGPHAWVNRVVLSSRILVWFGLISFPLYLWHWPLLSFVTIVTGATPTFSARIAAVAAAVALAWITTKFVERPLRFSKNPAMAPILLAVMLATGAAGYLIFAGGGLEGYGFRTSDKTAFAQYFDNSLPEWRYFERVGIPEKFRLDCDFDDPIYRYGRSTDVPRAAISSSCYERDPGRDKLLFLWGDSHVQMLYSGLRNNLPSNWQIMIVASSGCAPDAAVRDDSSAHYCQHSNWFAMEQIRKNRPDVVIVDQREQRSAGDLEKVEQVLTDDGVANILALGPTPRWKGSLPKLIMRRLWDQTPERTFVGLDESVAAEDKSMTLSFPRRPNARYVDVFRFFCNDAGCLTRIGDDRQAGSVTYDYGHLTPIASDYLAKNLLVALVTGAEVSAH